MDRTGHDHIIGIRDTGSGYAPVHLTDTEDPDDSFDFCPVDGASLPPNPAIAFIEWLACKLRKGDTLNKTTIATRLRDIADRLET